MTSASPGPFPAASGHSSCSQVPGNRPTRFPSSREPRGPAPWQSSLVPEPETDAGLLMPQNGAGVTFFLPEMEMGGSYFIQNKPGTAPGVWEDARVAEASEYRDLLGTLRPGDVWRTQPVRQGLWGAGLRSCVPTSGASVPGSHLLQGSSQVRTRDGKAGSN